MRTTMWRPGAWLFAAALLVMAGCGSTRTHFYSLAETAAPAVRAPAAVSARL